MLEGVKILPIKRNNDTRGFFAEIFREDWMRERVVQSNYSFSYPGVIRAWHKHERGQVDYFLVISGAIKIHITDFGYNKEEIYSCGRDMQIVRVPGNYWHGIEVVGNEPAYLIYFTTKLYDYENPDELRREFVKH